MNALLLLPALLAAEAPLTLDEVLLGADQAFPSLVAARADVDAAEGEALAASGGFDPVLKARAWHVPVGGYPQTRLDTVLEAPTPLWGTTVFGGYRLGVGKIQDYYGERRTWSAGELRAGVSVPVLKNGPSDRRRTALVKAEIARSLAGLGVEAQRLEVRRLASLRYWEWVAAGQRRQVARDLLRLAEDRARQLEGRARLGEAPRIEQQDNQRAVLQRQAALLQAERAVQQAAFELSLYLRGADGAVQAPDDARLPVELAEPGLEVDLQQVEARVARRPDLRRLTGQLEQTELDVSLARSQLLPGLEVGLAVSKDLGVSPGPSWDALGKTELELTASIELPLLLREGRGKLAQAQAARSKLDAQQRLARERALTDVRDLASALTAARGRGRLAHDEVRLAEQLEQAERVKLELGEGSVLFVTLREQTTAEARLRRVDALLDAHRAVAGLAAALAMP